MTKFRSIALLLTTMITSQSAFMETIYRRPTSSRHRLELEQVGLLRNPFLANIFFDKQYDENTEDINNKRISMSLYVSSTNFESDGYSRQRQHHVRPTTYHRHKNKIFNDYQRASSTKLINNRIRSDGHLGNKRQRGRFHPMRFLNWGKTNQNNRDFDSKGSASTITTTSAMKMQMVETGLEKNDTSTMISLQSKLNRFNVLPIVLNVCSGCVKLSQDMCVNLMNGLRRNKKMASVDMKLSRIPPRHFIDAKKQLVKSNRSSSSRNRRSVFTPPRTLLSTKKKNNRQDMLTRVLRLTIKFILHERWSKRATNFSVHVDPSPHTTFPRLLSQGEVGSNISLTFDKLSLPNLQLSGGGRLDINGLSVHVLALLLPRESPLGLLLNRGGKVPRFRSRFEFHARNCVFRQGDILSSSCIRNGLQTLLSRILRRNRILSATGVTVDSVNVLPSNKVSCTGEASTQWGIRVPFEVRSGLNTTATGQVLTFPGLELALGTGKSLGVFIPVIPEITVDIGDDAKVENIEIDGEERCIMVSARATVTPNEILFDGSRTRGRQDTVSPEEPSVVAHFACDAGKWVTNLGNFTA